jgi:hypothetical protein
VRPRGENVEYDKLAQRLANLEREYLDLDKLAVKQKDRIAQLEAEIADHKHANAVGAALLDAIRSERLTWAMGCECYCKACTRLDRLIRLGSVAETKGEQGG